MGSKTKKTRQITLDDFRQKFRGIKSEGFVPSLRSGPTGIGHTLESLLGIKENNIASPDFGHLEIKAHRADSTSMITLFTFNRKAWVTKPLEAIRRYGTRDKNGRLGLYFTMSTTPNSKGLFLHLETERIEIRHVSGEVIAQWKYSDLAEQFRKKVPALVLVTAAVEEVAGRECFKYLRAQILSGTSKNIIQSQIELGRILVDLRLHDKGTSARNHGTGFRVHERYITELFETVREIA